MIYKDDFFARERDLNIMGDWVNDLVDDLLGVFEKEEEPKESYVRFSVNITAADNRRLRYCLNKVGRSRAGFAADAIIAVLMELEERLGLVETDSKGQKQWNTWYHDHVVMPQSPEDFSKEFGFRPSSIVREGVEPNV